jgi:hypothetical protein
VTFKELTREAWEVAKGIAKTVPVRLSWRDALRIMRRSLPDALWERLVGTLVLLMMLSTFSVVIYVLYYLGRLTRGGP